MSRSNVFRLGLTGGIGSGKTTIANMFADLGASLVDADVIAHELTMPNGIAIEAIRTTFGENFIQADGAMNREKMREHVFSDPSEKSKLESILHPLIRQETSRVASMAQGAYVILVIPLLVESKNWKQKVSRLLVVDCEEQTQIKRVMIRSGLTNDQVTSIMRTQASRQQRLDAADDIIVNEGDLKLISQKVLALHTQYLYLASASGQNIAKND